MEKSTKIALVLGASGLAMNKYQGSKISLEKPALTQEESNLKMGGGAIAFLGFTSAVILEATKKHPKARKVAFVGLGVVSAGFVLTILYALKKMT
jgi:hypothetical protein